MRTGPSLLAVDIGNTNITFGFFQKNDLVKKFDIPTRLFSQKSLKAKLGGFSPAASLICSVVPHSTAKVKSALRSLSASKVYIIGKDIRVPIRNKYRRPKQVGQDRLVNAYAAVKLYGSPAIVVDFGTAVTFDVISKKGEYLGGMILPGLQISLEALNERTALLPKINPAKPREFIGRDTKNSMLSGIVYGFAALTDDLVKRIKKKIGKNVIVIATGGNSALLARFCRSIDTVDISLTLKGLYLIREEAGLK